MIQPEAVYRVRHTRLAQAQPAVVHDLVHLAEGVNARAVLVAGQIRMGSVMPADQERLRAASLELRSLLADVLDTVGDHPLAPEVVFDPCCIAEEVIRRFVDHAPTGLLRLASSLPADLWVPGRASFFARVLQHLLENAACNAQSEILVSLLPIGRPGARQVLMRVEDDRRAGDIVADLMRLDSEGKGDSHDREDVGGARSMVAPGGELTRVKRTGQAGGGFELRVAARRRRAQSVAPPSRPADSPTGGARSPRM
jgi:hypothetical protein